jgi:cysteinyl-tRNA synthetase
MHPPFYNNKLIIVLILILLFPSSNYGFSNNEKKISNGQSSIIPKISSWAYQLQNVNLQSLKESYFDLLVIDYSRDGSDAGKWTNNELESIKNEGKLIISYISIGEAENYRSYWQDSWLSSNHPGWLDEENLDWVGNYKVKYWDQEWQEIVYTYLDKIISQGFNGVYLDIIDAYEYYLDKNINNADELMIEFVHNISIYTRNKSEIEFLIIPQNGQDLLENNNYRSDISGIGIEDLYYNNDGSKNDQAVIDAKENLLSLLVSEEKLVLTVDYVNDESKQEDVYTKSRNKGFIPYTTNLALNVLTPPLLNSENITNSNTKNIDGYGYILTLLAIFSIGAKYKIKKSNKK